jgi:hypothetical protein
MKVLKAPWVQENQNVIENALIIPKSLSVSREDFETISFDTNEDGVVEWKSRMQLTCFLEVYPDQECFEKRVFPVAIFKKVVNSTVEDFNKLESRDYFITVLQSLINEKINNTQDFSTGILVDIEIKTYEF